MKRLSGSFLPARAAAMLRIAAGVLIVAGVIVQILVCTKRLMTPVDVSGTLFGGMGTAMDAAGWMAVTGGVLWAALLRLPGFRLAWVAAGGAPIVMGAFALYHYPEDYGGNLIFSPQRSEIVLMMILGGAFLAAGTILRRYAVAPRLSDRGLSRGACLLAMAGMALLFVALPIALQIEKHQPALPPCAHDAAGTQLTLCL